MFEFWRPILSAHFSSIQKKSDFEYQSSATLLSSLALLLSSSRPKAGAGPNRNHAGIVEFEGQYSIVAQSSINHEKRVKLVAKSLKDVGLKFK
jgi:hypothetical protein